MRPDGRGDRRLLQRRSRRHWGRGEIRLENRIIDKRPRPRLSSSRRFGAGDRLAVRGRVIAMPAAVGSAAAGRMVAPTLPRQQLQIAALLLDRERVQLG